MSSTRVTVKELRDRLAQYPDDMRVVTIWPGHYNHGEAKIEGNLDGPDNLEVIRAWEVRSGWLYPPSYAYMDDDDESCEELLVISDVGVQWLEPFCPHYSKIATKPDERCVKCETE